MTDRRTDGRTDRQTDRSTGKNNMFPDPSGGDINRIIHTWNIALMYNFEFCLTAFSISTLSDAAPLNLYEDNSGCKFYDV